MPPSASIVGENGEMFLEEWHHLTRDAKVVSVEGASDDDEQRSATGCFVSDWGVILRVDDIHTLIVYP